MGILLVRHGYVTVQEMRLGTKWGVFSIGGCLLIAAALLVFPGALFVFLPPPLDVLANVIFWPVAICEQFVGPGPSLGSPSEHLHEGTPVHMVAAAIGIALSWMFWSSLIFVVIRVRASTRNRVAGVGQQ